MRELVVLGTASQAPTRDRNHNGYLLLWDGEGLLFDPGEGTQRQLLLAGVAASRITRIFLTHFHGDHCLGLPGIFARMHLDQVSHPVDVCFPASGAQLYRQLRDLLGPPPPDSFPRLREHPIAGGEVVLPQALFTVEAVALSHRVDSFGYRLTEPDGRRMLPQRLAEAGISGPAVGQLQREGRIRRADGRVVTVDEMSTVRVGQRFAFVMDSRMCAGVQQLAAGADLLAVEATFLDADRELAREFGHLTAGEAARVATAAGVRTLVLTHFSQRYPELSGHYAEASRYFDGELVVATDLLRVPVPARR